MTPAPIPRQIEVHARPQKYENGRTKSKDIELFGRLSTFTDDTVLTVAVAAAILADRDYARAIKSYARRYGIPDILRKADEIGVA